MSKFVKVHLSQSTSDGYSSRNNASNLINLYTKAEVAGSKSNTVIIGTSGYEDINSVDGDILGIYEFKQKIYIATKNKLFLLNSGVIEELAEIDLYQDAVFADNGIDIMIVGGNGYAYNPETKKLKNMSDEDGWYKSDSVTYLDGYFIFNRTETGQFFISKLYSTEIDPIDWATAESAPDDTIRVMTVGRTLWIIGEKSTEAWYNSGSSDFPFTRINGAITDIGSLSNRTVVKVRNSLVFAGIDNKIYMTNGYTLNQISNTSIEKKLIDSKRENIYAFSYSESGTYFYVITIDDKGTFAYDSSTGLWHERRSTNKSNWAIQNAINYYKDGSSIGYHENKICNISESIFSENGKYIQREIVTLPLNSTVNRMIIHSLILDMEVGYSETAKVEAQISRDSGNTWENKLVSTTGGVGHFKKQIKFNRLGQAVDAMFKFTINQQIPIKILGCHIRISS